MKGKLFLLFFILFVNRFIAQDYKFGWHEDLLRHDDLTRHFRFYIPTNINDDIPMVILLHPENEGMNTIFNVDAGATKEWPVLAEIEKFILMVPNGVNAETGNTDGNNQRWNDCRKQLNNIRRLTETDDAGFINSLISWAIENLPIDPNRVYAAGISNGGMMVFRLVNEIGDKLAAVAVFLASLPLYSECNDEFEPIPVMIVNGTDDMIVPYRGGGLEGNRGEVLSAESMLNYWIKLNGLEPQSRTLKYYDDINKVDGSFVIKNEFNRPFENPPVQFLVINGGGHVMPSIKHPVPAPTLKKLLGNQNRDIESAYEAWKFFGNFDNTDFE